MISRVSGRGLLQMIFLFNWEWFLGWTCQLSGVYNVIPSNWMTMLWDSSASPLWRLICVYPTYPSLTKQQWELEDFIFDVNLLQCNSVSFVKRMLMLRHRFYNPPKTNTEGKYRIAIHTYVLAGFKSLTINTYCQCIEILILAAVKSP